MLTIKIEMWPKGDRSRACEIGRTYIFNTTSTNPRSNYAGAVCRRGVYEPHREAMSKATRKLEVFDYPRESLNVWCLVTRALLSAFPEEARRAARGVGKDDTLRQVTQALGLTEEASGEELVAAIEKLKEGIP